MLLTIRAGVQHIRATMHRLAKTALAVLFASASLNLLAAAGEGVKLSQLQDRVKVEIDGQLFTEYYFADVPRPFCYPIMGPGDVAMTRNWPMKTVEGEEQDHKHHRSLWFTHGAVNGQDFWSEDPKAGKIVHDKFLQVESGKDTGILRTANKWTSAGGELICTDERTLRFYRPGADSARILDFQVTIKTASGDLVFGDTKEGSMGIRLAETMRLKGKVGKGHIENSAGVKDNDTWGKRAEWCDYYGPAEGKLVGVAIFDHPTNPRHPTWWHVRDYGLFAANPFGKHDFEKLSDKTAGDLKVPAGQSITFKYRFVFHEGETSSAKLPEKYQDYVKSVK